MVKKVIHLADIHLRTYRMHDTYGEAFKTLLKELRELVEPYDRNEVRIVIAGDFVHQKIIISNEMITLGTWFLQKLEKIAPVVLIAGNHDLLENNKDRLDSLTPLVQLLQGSGIDIKYLKTSECTLDENIVWCNYSIFEEHKRPDIETARKEHGNDKSYIGLYHAPLQGAKTDLGYEFESGNSLDMFEGLDMAMLGDIHMRQGFIHQELKHIIESEIEEYKKMGWKVNGGLPDEVHVSKLIPIAYPSSLIQQNFGESVSNHGFLLWDIEERTFEEYNIDTSFGFYQFKINSLTDLDNNKEIFMNP
jgi:DNA repair exonuclease SbcCD nuclease subunit